ncbi:hypothetical protein D3C72_359910 [compost metagenome]
MLHVGGIVSGRQVGKGIRSHIGYPVQRILDLAYNRRVYIDCYRVSWNIVGTVRHHRCSRLDVYARIYREGQRCYRTSVGIFYVDSVGLPAVQVLVDEKILHKICSVVGIQARKIRSRSSCRRNRDRPVIISKAGFRRSVYGCRKRCCRLCYGNVRQYDFASNRVSYIYRISSGR